MNRLSLAAAITAALSFPLAELSAQLTPQTVVLPASNDGLEANSFSSIPWARERRSCRIQQSYPAAVLSEAGLNIPLILLGIRYRCDGGRTVSIGSTYGNVRMSLSTMSVPHTQLSSMFDANHGADLVSVFSGSVIIGRTAGTSPNDFYVDIGFSSPFAYDPSAGDLLIDIQSDGNAFSGVDTAQQDFAFGVNATRAYNLSDDNATTATTVAGGASVIELRYIPQPGLYPFLSADRVTGSLPLQAQFSDDSITTEMGGVTSWAWDLDGDGTVDSNAQNPAFTYTAPGVYDVTLTVSDGVRTETVTEMGFVEAIQPVDPGIAEELQFQFNEVRGDIVGNSALSAAAGTAPAFGTVDTNPWQGTPGRPGFGANEPGAGMLAGTGVAQDATVRTGHPILLGSGDMTICWWQRVVPGAASGPDPFFAWGGPRPTDPPRCFTSQAARNGLIYRDGGNGTIPDIAMASGTDLFSLADWHHIALVVDNGAGRATWYLDGNRNSVSEFLPGTHTFDNTEFRIGWHTNRSQNYARVFDMDDFRFYTRPLSLAEVNHLAENSETAAVTPWGGICGSGAPVARGVGLPTIGNINFGVQVSNAPPSAPVIFAFGLFPINRGPADVSFLLGAGCVIEAPLRSTFALASSPTGELTIPLPIPNDSALSGAHAYCQFLPLNGLQGEFARALDLHVR